MPCDWFLSINEPFENTIVINKSRFITTLLPIKDYDDAIKKIKEINKLYSDATHNCYAFISNVQATEQRFSDDGEPQGTAGIPMLEVLKKRKVYMTLAVVTRYFGGIKLGANGLVGAYSSSVSQALDNAALVKNQSADILRIKVGYGIYKKIEDCVESYEGQVISTEYGNDVVLEVAVPIEKSKDFCDKTIDISLDKAIVEKIETKYFQFKI